MIMHKTTSSIPSWKGTIWNIEEKVIYNILEICWFICLRTMPVNDWYSSCLYFQHVPLGLNHRNLKKILPVIQSRWIYVAWRIFRAMTVIWIGWFFWDHRFYVRATKNRHFSRKKNAMLGHCIVWNREVSYDSNYHIANFISPVCPMISG